MNKRDLIDAISGRMGDKKTAAEAVNAVLDAIQDTVARGDKVSITGFGVFEKQVRPARTARNPSTGAAVKVPKTSVPKFRAGTDFKARVNASSRGSRGRTDQAGPGGQKRGQATARAGRSAAGQSVRTGRRSRAST
jgi:DNA-binding protein HU-beta